MGGDLQLGPDPARGAGHLARRRATLPYHENVAHAWGLISAHAHKRGHPSDSNDSWIAASCLAYGLPLATLNIKHYHAFATHERLELVTGR